MATSTNNVTLTFVQQDVNGVNILATPQSNGRVVGPVSLSGTAGQFTEGMQIGASPTSITLPISPVVNLYIKNLHASQTLTITATPNAGASAILGTIGPGEIFLWWGIASARGFTALSLQASGAATGVEMFLGG